MPTHRLGPTTARLMHRAMTPTDAPAFFALNSHPEVMRHTGEPPLRSVDEARAAIENYPDFDAVGFGRWGCFLRSTGALVGFCGLKHLPELDMVLASNHVITSKTELAPNPNLGHVDVGFRFLPEYWGRGLATEACLASLEFGFGVLGLSTILALVLPENTASIRVLEKCGLSRVTRNSQPQNVTYVGLTAWLYAKSRAATRE